MVLLRDSETGWNLSKLAKSSDMSFVYVSRLAAKMQHDGLIISESKGKKRMLKLTEKGAKVANAVFELMNRMQE